MPLRLPPYTGTTKAGSLPSSGLVDRRHRYYEPLGLPPSTIPFRHRLIGTAFARRGPPGRVSPVPYQAVLTCPPPYPVGVLHPSGLTDAVCCLRRGMSDSATHPFRAPMSRGCKVHLSIGPANLLPSQKPYGLLRAFDIPLGRASSRSLVRDLLRGAPALTATGLSPASLIQHDSPLRANLQDAPCRPV